MILSEAEKLKIILRVLCCIILVLTDSM